MRFHEEVVMRVLPYTKKDLIKQVSIQLGEGTILQIEPLGRYSNEVGLTFSTRLNVDDGSNLAYYKVSNDERRIMLRTISQLKNLLYGI